jgi:zinc protease
VVAVRTAFHGGQLAETRENAGISAFLSGMWLRGTRSRSAADFARSVENLAADLDTFSGRNSIGTTLEVARGEFAPALDLFAEVLLEPAFDSEELERERRDALAAIERREDRLAQQAFMLFGEALFPHHPYRLPLSGFRDSITALTPDRIKAHHQRLVRCDSLVIAIAGDIDPDEAAHAIATRLAELPQSGEARVDPAIDPVPEAIQVVERIKDRAQTHIVLGFPGLTIHDEDRFALEIISQLLAGQGGRLFLELRDRRSLAYSVSAANVEGVAPGFFSVYIATAPEKADEARSGMLEQLEVLVSEKPKQAELQRAARYLTGSDVIGQQRNASHAAHMALDALYGLGPTAHQRYAEAVQSVTAEDVLRVAERIIRLDAYTLAIIRP